MRSQAGATPPEHRTCSSELLATAINAFLILLVTLPSRELFMLRLTVYDDLGVKKSMSFNT